MNKNFLKSLTAGVVGLTLVASCSMMKKNDQKNPSSSAKKEDSNKCSASKAESKKVSQVKKAKKHTKSEIK